MGVGTRTEVKRAISKGRVSVDGACVKKPETKIDTEETTVVFDGQTVGYTKKEYYMLHKPAGVISATEDAREKTVIDLIVSRKRKDLICLLAGNHIVRLRQYNRHLEGSVSGSRKVPV